MPSALANASLDHVARSALTYACITVIDGYVTARGLESRRCSRTTCRIAVRVGELTDRRGMALVDARVGAWFAASGLDTKAA
jgi:hypothetical protein